MLEYRFFARSLGSNHHLPLAKTRDLGRLLGHRGLRATERWDIGFLDEDPRNGLIARLSLACV